MNESGPDFYVACLGDPLGWGGGISAARGLTVALQARGQRVQLVGAVPQVTRETNSRLALAPDDDADAPITLNSAARGGSWRIHSWLLARRLATQLRRLPAPSMGFVANSPFWVVAARQAWPRVPIIYRFPCLLTHCLPFTWPSDRPPTFWTRVNYWGTRHIERRALRIADRVLAATDENVEEIREFAPCCAARVTKCWFGVRPGGPTTAGSVIQPHGATARMLLAVGVCDANKNFAALLRALPRLSARIRVTIVGDGPEKEHLQSLAVELSVAHRVRFVAPQSDLGPYYRDADLVVSTSRYDAFPNVLREAMCFGTPIVAPDNDPPRCYSGIASTIRTADCGWLYTADDEASLVDVIGAALAKNDALAARGDNGLRFATTNFRWDDCVDRIITDATKPISPADNVVFSP